MKTAPLLVLSGVLVLGLMAFALSDADFLEGRWQKTESADTDGDGLADNFELALKTDPKNPDTDGGGVPDGTELANKLDPTDITDDVIMAQILEEKGEVSTEDAKVDQPKEGTEELQDTQVNPTGVK